MVSGNTVPHLHMHLIPRYPSTPKEHRGAWEVYDWTDAPMGHNDQIVEVCIRISTFLKSDNHDK